jgi:hypothetical protein
VLLFEALEGFDRSWLLDFSAALFAGAPRVVVPEIEHRLTEMLHDVGAIEVNVFHERFAILAIKDHVLLFPGRTPPLDDDPDRVWRALWRMCHVRRNEEGFTLANDVIDDAVAFANAHFDVAFELVEILFGIDEMKIVPRVRPLDDHHKKVAPVVEITITYRRLEFFAVLFNPVF